MKRNYFFLRIHYHPDELKDEPILVPAGIPPISPPQHQFDISPPKLSEVKEAVHLQPGQKFPGCAETPLEKHEDCVGKASYPQSRLRGEGSLVLVKCSNKKKAAIGF